MERATGIEPVTSSLGSWHSTAELRPLYFQFLTEHGSTAKRHRYRLWKVRVRRRRASALRQASSLSPVESAHPTPQDARIFV